ncbi:32250_t:CDS:2, partial [Gigaspora margarita]
MEGITFKIVPFYTGIFAFYYVLLSLRIISIRRKYHIALGDGLLEFIAFVDQERTKSLPDVDSSTKMAHPFSNVNIDYTKFRQLQRAVRAHANFSEFIPLGLLSIFFIEINNYLSSTWIHIVCGALLVSRICHAELAFNDKNNKLAVNNWRRIGM